MMISYSALSNTDHYKVPPAALSSPNSQLSTQATFTLARFDGSIPFKLELRMQ